jgi:general secretion pathway protein G
MGPITSFQPKEKVVLERLRVARKNESGFTLIELLIVIVILGILAGIVVFAVGAFNDRGELAACKADKKNVEVAVEAYRAKLSAYPASAAAMPAASDARMLLLTDPNADGNLTDGYLREVPGKSKYTIQITDNNGTVAAVGPNDAGAAPAGC